MHPWLGVPLGDYEGHMRAPGVGQLAALSQLFADALARCRPASVAVLGVAGGNGLEHVDARVTSRVVGLDINPAYLDAVRQRHPALPGLELHCVDLAEDALSLEPVSLVHAAMVFEHAGVARCLDNALSLVAPGGVLSVVLQLRSDRESPVGVSQFPSMAALAGDFALLDPHRFRRLLAQQDLVLSHQSRRTLPAGKAFWWGVFERR